jgi:hypothetical protein
VLTLALPALLKEEFATVEALWHSTAKTKRVDALMLSWVKYEKQLRRLFCFLVFQHPNIGAQEIDDVVAAVVDNHNLYPETFIRGIAALGVKPVPALLDARYRDLWGQISRIKKYRNKLMHGQITGQNINSPQLERDILCIVDWVASLAAAADATFGYDGLKRNTYRVAKSASKIAVDNYPFGTLSEFKKWLSTIA